MKVREEFKLGKAILDIDDNGIGYCKIELEHLITGRVYELTIPETANIDPILLKYQLDILESIRDEKINSIL